MNAAKRLWAATLLSGLVVSLTSISAGAGENEGKTPRREGQSSTRMSSNADKTNVQWSADPEKGWVRANERPAPVDDKKDKQDSKKKENDKQNGAKKNPTERKQ
jgi:hypothetical protein